MFRTVKDTRCLSIEQAMMPDGAMAFAPTLGLGVGARIFLNSDRAIRIQVRDELLLEKRIKAVESQANFLKQNVSITVGYSILGKAK